jgi:hypothetical protein
LPAIIHQLYFTMGLLVIKFKKWYIRDMYVKYILILLNLELRHCILKMLNRVSSFKSKVIKSFIPMNGGNVLWNY